MNLKKFISGVSALTIAASAFAGMAVTASAAAEELSNWKVITNVTDPDTGDVITKTPWTYPNATMTTSDTAVTAVATGSGNRTATYSFAANQTYTAGTVNIVYTLNLSSNLGRRNRSNASFAIMGSGKKILDINATWNDSENTDTSNGVTVTNYNVVAGNQSDPITINAKNTYTVNASVNLDDSTITYTVSGNGQTVSHENIAISDEIKNVNALQFVVPREGATVTFGTFTINHITAPAKTLTLNYGAAGSEEIDVKGYSVGDEVPYTYPKYIVKGNTLYKSDATTYSSKRALAAAEDSVDVAYTSQGTGTYQFADFSSSTYKDYSVASGGSFADTTEVSMVVEADGVYRIDGDAFGTSSGRWVTIKVNGTAIGNYNPTGYNSAFHDSYPFTATGIELKAGDVVSFKNRDSRGSFIDYALLTKTADLPVALSGMATESVAGTDNSVGVIAKGTVNGVNTVDKLTITANGETKEKVRGTDYTFNTDLGGSSVEIAIIVLGVSSVDSIKIN